MEYWEPRQYQPGDQVRVRLSRECTCFDYRENGEDGRIGWVDSVDRNSRDGSHPIKVYYENPIRHGPFRCIGGLFAAVELVPVEGKGGSWPPRRTGAMPPARSEPRPATGVEPAW